MPELEPVNDEAAPGVAKPSAYISARHRQDAVMKPVHASGGDVVAGICAIAALIFYAAILFMLYDDFKILGGA
ncbi:MAG: hypothetical protein GX571_06630 [Lentisphaerae bacterium]|jgi:hypothetical protein|nr:hypothetical protein [Lentisphaerota bacterium]